MKSLKKLGALLITFALPLFNAQAFSDVPTDAWFAEPVNQLAGIGIIDPVELFRPTEGLIRAELVKMVILARGTDENYTSPEHPTFDDVPKTIWFSPFVEQAATLGIVSGYSDANGNLTGIFDPSGMVTRAMAIKVLVEAFALQETSTTTTGFPDVNQADWFYDYVRIAHQNGLIKGYESGLFGPNNPVSRAEMAKMLYLAMQVIKTPPVEEGETEQIPEEEPVQTPEEESSPEGVEPEAIQFTPSNLSVTSSLTNPSTNEKLVGRYNFRGIKEGVRVQTLTVANDLSGYFGDETQGSLAIKEVTLKFPNENGVAKQITNPLDSSGKARFSNLDFFVKRDVDTSLEIYVTLNSFADIGPILSGEMIRLGLQNTENTTQSFKAVGAVSGSTLSFGSGTFFNSGASTEPLIVKKSVPLLEIVSPSKALINGSNDLLSMKLTASGGSVSLGRLTFEVTISDEDAANLNLQDFEFEINSKPITDAVIYNATGDQELMTGNLENGVYTIIVSFNKEQIISANQTSELTLKATVTGSNSGDAVVTRLLSDLNPLSGLTAENQANTGKIFSQADVTSGIFTTDTAFSRLAANNKNFIWSDLSAQPHLYPSVTEGAVVSNSGSDDWTNGYLLNMSKMENSVLSK